jgi:DNA-binding CsgD family transcriptional regulator
MNSWSVLDPETRRLARQVLTPAERDAHNLHAQGFGYRRMALALGIDRDTARSRCDRAERKLAAARTGGRESRGTTGHHGSPVSTAAPAGDDTEHQGV